MRARRGRALLELMVEEVQGSDASDVALFQEGERLLVVLELGAKGMKGLVVGLVALLGCVPERFLESFLGVPGRGSWRCSWRCWRVLSAARSWIACCR